MLLATIASSVAAAAPTDLKWSLNLPQNIQSPSLNSEGTIYVTSSQNKAGTLHAICDNGSRGTEAYTPHTLQGSNATSLPAPVIGDDDTVYFGPNTGAKSPGIYAFTPSLQRKWYASTSGHGGAGGGLCIGSDGVIFKVGGELMAVNPGGTVVGWPVRQSKCNEDCAPIVGLDGMLYFSRTAKEFNQVDPKTGAIVYTWSLANEIHSAPAVGDDGLIYLCTTKQIFALNPTDHTRRTLYDPPSKTGVDFRGTSPVIGPDGTLYLGNGKKTFYAIDSQTGVLMATLDTQGAINAPAAIAADGTVYFGTGGGYFYAVRLEGPNLSVKGRYAGSGNIRSAPAIADDGTVYVTNDAGYLLAFRGTTGPANSAWPMYQQNPQRTGLARKPRVLVPPTLVTQPISQTVHAGATVTFVVEATGNEPLVFSWLKDGQLIPGAQSHELTLSSVTEEHVGSYQVLVANDDGTANSETADLELIAEPGWVQFNNRDQLLGLDAPILDADGATRLAGSQFTVELWAGATPDELFPVELSRSGFRTGAAAGYFTAGAIELPSVLAGTTAWLQVRVWDNDDGLIETYEDAIATYRKSGVSDIFSVVPLGSPDSGPPLLGLQGFALEEPMVPPGEITLSQEPSGTVCQGDQVLLCATVNGDPPFSYQWYAGENPIPGQTEPCLLLESADPEDSGEYWVSINNEAGSASSDSLLVSIETKVSAITRFLPPFYAPGKSLQVELLVEPGCGADAYALEDMPPQDWVVASVSDGGRWDELTQRVKWVFTDGGARLLSYSLVPATTALGVATFDGVGSVDGESMPVLGDATITGARPHPADAPGGDWRLTQDEVTAYIAAYKRGSDWSEGPNPIPLTYAVRAAHVYLRGEQYHYDADMIEPLCWVPGTTQALPTGLLGSASAPEVLVSSTRTESALRVILSITPLPESSTYGIELELPSGCGATEISDGGVLDSENDRIKWVFLDGQPRTLEATVTGSLPLTPLMKGLASFDGTSEPFPDRPQFIGLPKMEDHGVTVRVFAPAGRGYVLQASEDLSDWKSITSAFQGTGEVMDLLDSEAQFPLKRFYRIKRAEEEDATSLRQPN